MAAEAPLQDLVEEATCSICLDYFQDPVLIPKCGHNFCRSCLTRTWGTSKSKASCPQCRQSFGPRYLLPNRQLERMVEVARRCGGLRGEEGGSFCPKHREPHKLFCKHHQTLICVVCDRSREHWGHSVIPAEEAFPEYQNKVADCLKAQKEQKEKIATYRRDTEQTVQEMLDIMKEVKQNVVAEFRELQLWLEAQENLLLTKMEDTEKDILARKEKGLAKHTEELCSLDHLIQEIEEKQQQPGSKLLQDIGSILWKYQATKTYQNPVDLLLDSKSTVWDYSDMTVLLKRAMKKLRDTLQSGLQLQEENVILDPDTANPDCLKISSDRKSVRGIKRAKTTNDARNCKRFKTNPYVKGQSVTGLKSVKTIYPVPNRKGFVYNPYVLGCQEFSTGRHFWEVIVGDRDGWYVGVDKKPENVRNVYVRMRWQIGQWGGKYWAISSKGKEKETSELVLTVRPMRICIALNCEEGQLNFFDARTAALLHTFSDASLVGGTLRPSFCLYEGACMALPSKKGYP